ncbi:hypothetical protein HW537_11220, partial [Asaia siamensis]
MTFSQPGSLPYEDRLNFTGLVYVYSDVPVEAITPPATRERVSIPGAELDDQRRDFFSQDIRASGPTLKAEFAGIIEFKNWGDVKAT